MPILAAGALGPSNALPPSDCSSDSSSGDHESGSGSLDLERAPFDWVLDAIDSLTPKQLLLAAAHAVGVPVISSMGAGGWSGAREQGVCVCFNSLKSDD